MTTERGYECLRSQLQEMEEMMLSAAEEAGKQAGESLRRVIVSGGKRLRPSLAWICYHLADSREMEILPLMCTLEMMHTASLIHDDVVDNACQRRNTPTIHTKYGTQFAVQCGDYLLAKAMEYMIPYQGTEIVEALSDTSRQMCLGEFQQMQGLYSLKMQTLESYHIQICQKTAKLLGASTLSGALAGGMNREEAEALKKFGENLGVAFQLQDDLLDFASDADTGKPPGQDIRNGIFTMPVLYVMKEYPDKEIASLLEQRQKSERETARILEYIEHAGGVRYTKEQITKRSEEAVVCLERFPETTPKKMLRGMVSRLMERRS